MKKVIRVHRSGMIYIVISIVMGVLAINGGNNIHYLAAAALLGYMLASGIAGYRNLYGAHVLITFPDEIYAGIPFFANIEIENRNRFVPLFLLQARIGPNSALFSVIQAGTKERHMLLCTIPSRGFHDAEEVEISSVYPFNFFTRYRWLAASERILVFPQPLRPISSLPLTHEKEEEEWGRSASREADADIVGVRPYVEGDSMRRIHWKSSARTGKLNSRLYDETDDGRSRILDVDRLLRIGREEGLSIASYEIERAIREGRAIGMKLHDELYAPASARIDKLRMLAALACYE